MVIKRMLGTTGLAQELAKETILARQPAKAAEETRSDTSFMMFGPSIWDGLEEAAFQGALVKAYPLKTHKSVH